MTDQTRKQQIKEIYERQIDRVYRTAVIYTGNTHDAEDVAESVFLTVIEKNIVFKNEDHEKAWFLTATRNRCKDLHKSAWKGKVTLSGYEDAALQAGSVASEIVTSEDANEYARSESARLLMKLPMERREAVYLCYYEGYTLKEAADMMGIKESKVRSALQAAKRQLRGEAR